jgi:hypothetical protein
MNRVGGRQFDQQGRIANGVSSGKLTGGETKNLENREVNLNKEMRTDRANNDGHLTNQEKSQDNRQQHINRTIRADRQASSGSLNRQQIRQVYHQQNRAGRQINRQRHG